jgi:hypothetical protein
MAASTSKAKKKSGNPAKRPTSAAGWKRQQGEELELPSGNVALVKRPGPQALLSEGILPDTLMPIVQQAISKGKGLRPTDMNAMLEDPKALAEMLDAMDRLLVKVIVEPKVAYHKRQVPPAEGQTVALDNLPWETISEDERDTEENVYTDEIDLEDKMFIFNYAVGGTRDLERFRSEHEARLGDISDGSGDEDPTE